MRENAKKFDWAGVEFPPTLDNIDVFEENNPYAINVLVLEKDNRVCPVRLSKKYASIVIHLLVLMNEDTEHYCWVKDINKLMTKQVTLRNGKREYCSRCLGSFNSKKKLDKHLQLCGIICRHETAKIECDTGMKECHHGWRKKSYRDCKIERERF